MGTTLPARSERARGRVSEEETVGWGKLEGADGAGLRGLFARWMDGGTKIGGGRTRV